MPKKATLKQIHSRNQTTKSKFFLNETFYPTTSLCKRLNTTHSCFSPTKKLLKLNSLRDSEKDSNKTSHLLKLFAFKHREKCQSTSKDEKVNKEIIWEPSPRNEGVCSETDDEKSNSRIIKYTPLEKQYLQFKSRYSSIILMVECGYKYKFFDEDAKIASEVLNIGCFKYHNFMSATIPVQRLQYHVTKLVSEGYKVGVIKQTESSALKAASSNRNELFSRELNALYSKSTLVGEEFSIPDYNEEEFIEIVEASSSYLMCITEKLDIDSSDYYRIAIVAIDVTSGDFKYSSFQDSHMRNKLENHLLHLNPSEILLSSVVCKETLNLVRRFSNESNSRIELLEEEIFNHSFALERVTSFYSDFWKSHDSNMDIQNLLSLPELIISGLSGLIAYLSEFKLEKVLQNFENLTPLTSEKHMILNAATLRGLDILSNSNSTECNSLFKVLDRTLTPFGKRLLKFWITKPLTDIELIEERLNIVTEFLHSKSIVFKIVQKVFDSKLPDLEKMLCSIFYHKCSCYDFLRLMNVLHLVSKECGSISDKVFTEIEAPRLKIIFSDLICQLQDCEKFLNNINSEAAKEGDKTKIFVNSSMFPELEKCKIEILSTEAKLNNLCTQICKTLQLTNFKYSTVAGQKYLIEVPESHIRLVPMNWLKISSTKSVSRFRSPEVIKFCNELEQQNELLVGYAAKAWISFLEDFNRNFLQYKRIISYLAEIDCYMSLAKVSKEENFCRPHIKDSDQQCFNIKQGWHPIIKNTMGGKNQFVTNDISMNNSNSCLIVTGPNMGGKSTYVRQTALIAIMAQIGSYVPAESVELSILDNIHVRMGAEDDVMNKQSTFMVEMSETSEILSNSTKRSFVILDELGRGTSTHDGMSIAYATLEHLISKVFCFVLFVTHYPSIIELKKIYPDKVAIVHMGYMLRESNDDELDTVTFLYNVVQGASGKSYGINVASLAGIEKRLLVEAQTISHEVEIKCFIKRKIKEIIEHTSF